MSSDPSHQARQRMVREQILARGIRDPRILAAMEDIPRERFLPPENRGEAFEDRAARIHGEQSISQPYIVAVMTECLDLHSDHRVLEIGTGSGYQTAILARLAKTVYTIERLTLLSDEARTLLDTLGLVNVSYRVGDGSMGWPEEVPFDRIMVTAAAPRIPDSLVGQLADGGRMVIPVGGVGEQILTVIERRGPTVIETPRLGCRFVKLIGREAWSEFPE